VSLVRRTVGIGDGRPTGAGPALAAARPAASLERDDLPLEDYDHLTLGVLRSRIRRLDVAELAQLREYEQAHADRLPVIKTLDARIVKLAPQSPP
jgi:hypothetical protein